MPQTNWKIAIIRRGDFGQRRRKIKKSYWLSENTTRTKFDTFAIKLRITFAAGGDRLAHCMGTQAVSGDQPWQNNVPQDAELAWARWAPVPVADSNGPHQSDHHVDHDSIN